MFTFHGITTGCLLITLNPLTFFRSATFDQYPISHCVAFCLISRNIGFDLQTAASATHGPPQAEKSKCASHLTPHTSHLTPRTSHLTTHTSHLTPHTAYLTPHTSQLTPHTSHLTPHTSHLTPHTSHLTPHTSHLTPHTYSPNVTSPAQFIGDSITCGYGSLGSEATKG
jgi:hypothetical protein